MRVFSEVLATFWPLWWLLGWIPFEKIHCIIHLWFVHFFMFSCIIYSIIEVLFSGTPIIRCKILIFVFFCFLILIFFYFGETFFTILFLKQCIELFRTYFKFSSILGLWISFFFLFRISDLLSQIQYLFLSIWGYSSCLL